MQRQLRFAGARGLATGLLLVLAACSTAGSDGEPVSPPADVDLTVVAENFSFDTSELRLTAGEETALFFVNRDPEAHNIAIYPDSSGGEPLFRGRLIDGDSGVYRIPPLEPGTYHFQCDPHPIMNGTVVVEEASS